VHVDPVGAQFIGDVCRELGIDDWEHVGGRFDDAHVQAGVAQGLGGLQTDEPGAQDDGACGALLHPTADRVRVWDRPKGPHPRVVDARDRWADGIRPGGQDERVVADGLLAAFGTAHGDLAGCRVDRGGEGVDADLEAEGGGE
jgi:hypothetical protein